MGRRESIISVNGLAGGANIDKAVRESEEFKVLEYLDRVCAARIWRLGPGWLWRTVQ